MPAAASPPLQGDDLQWIELTDFRQGIVGDRQGSLLMVDGAARAHIFGLGLVTQGCVADPQSGMLMPLPAASATKTLSAIPPADLSGNLGASNTFYPANLQAAFILDARVIGPMIGSVDFDRLPTPGGRADAVAILWGFWYNTAGTGANFSEYVLGRLYQGNVGTPWGTTVDFHFQKSTATVSTFPRSLPIGSLEMTRSVPSTVSPPFQMSALHPVLAFSTAFTRTIPQTQDAAIAVADQALTTFDTDIGAFYRVGANPASGNPISVHGLFPDPNSAVQSVRGLPLLSQSCLMLVAHQGRLVAMSSMPWAGFDYPRALSIPMDYLHYNPEPGQIFAPVGVVSYNFLNAIDENPSGVGTAASLNANTFFAVKHTGGGYLVQGDLDNPDVVRLPFIHSTYGIVSRGCYTPLGYVYLGRNGVYAYKGGDSTKMLTPQIDGLARTTATIADPFLPWWDARTVNSPNEPYAGAVGRLAWWDPFVVIPNGWLLDTRSHAMWRLTAASFDNTPNQMFYDVSPATGDLFAFRQKVTAAALTAWEVFQRDGVGRAFYTWCSQPFVVSRDRFVELREVELIAASSDQSPAITATIVTVYFYTNKASSEGTEGTLVGTATFTLGTTNGTGWRSHRMRVSVVPTTAGNVAYGRNITAYVNVATTSSAPAPKVAFRIGWRPGREIAKDT